MFVKQATEMEWQNAYSGVEVSHTTPAIITIVYYNM